VHFGSSGTPRVFKRVADWGNGWMPTVRDLGDFADGCSKLRAACEASGRDFGDVHVSPLVLEGLFRTRAERDALAGAGADEIIVWITATETNAVLDELEVLAGELIDT
jgi:alkanesulfonate monooxygenase SsuD/methylene tetrahydromethanopterin reductase-like flavin-dependent oxidoreductase (luciferase family)